jgi:arsenate reductase-like glutaredoxin family protein
MKKVDWSYHRPGCKTCGKTQAYLNEHAIPVVEEVNAKKTKLGEQEALGLLKSADELLATKGKAVVCIDLKRQRPDDETLIGLVIGPTGNLRAPTVRVGKKLIVGFDEATYRAVLGGG